MHLCTFKVFKLKLFNTLILNNIYFLNLNLKGNGTYSTKAKKPYHRGTEENFYIIIVNILKEDSVFLAQYAEIGKSNYKPKQSLAFIFNVSVALIFYN